MSTQPARRPTQQERKQATVGRLIDATISAIAEVGYGRASLGEICARSGVSRGGLFRHFDSRLTLMVAAAEEVARRHFAEVRRRLADQPDLSLRAAITLMRERHQATDNVVWFELLVAARTDKDLRDRLTPAAERFFQAISEVAREIPAVAALNDEQRHLLISSLRHLFDGEAIARIVVPEPTVEARRLDLLLDHADLILNSRARTAH